MGGDMPGVQIQGAVVVLTGASSGIGRAAALAFARRGAKLVLAARDADALNDVVDTCRRLGATASAVPTDVTDSQAVHQLARAAADMHGRIDVWINNAGVGAVGRFETIPMAAHEQVVQTDLIGYVRGAHAVVPYFKRQRSGVLINTLSLGSWAEQPYAASYSAAKFGLVGFTAALHGELSAWPDIQVCDVYPSLVDSPGLRDAGNYTGRQIKPMLPAVSPQTVAEVMVSLAERPRRSVTVGNLARFVRIAHLLTPGYGRLAARMVEFMLGLSRPAAATSGNLFQPPASRRLDGAGLSPGGSRHGLLIAGIATTVVAGMLLTRKRRP